ncbi:Kelch repeat-containing protein [Ferruginibacter profundus]
MKKITLLCLITSISCFLFTCKKSEDVNHQLGPGDIAALNIQITKTLQTELNEFDISYIIKETAHGDYKNVFFQWSTDPEFKTDTFRVTVTPNTTGETMLYHLSNLKEGTRYYGRLSATYRSIQSFSERKEWTTDSLVVIRAGYLGVARGFNRGDTIEAITNLFGITGTNSKVLVGPYDCPIIKDNGSGITFAVPATIPPGKYVFRVFTHNMDAKASDSTQILRGKWRFINSPDIPVNPAASAAGLMFFGTCNSAQKGYIVGGQYFNGPPVGVPNSQFPEYFIEFDPQSFSWTKKYPVSPRYIDYPICYYYNNSIYVISAQEWSLDPLGGPLKNKILKKIMRLDPVSLNWVDMGDVPYPHLKGPSSFEYNNEWYIGMGLDSVTGDYSNKFWKYNPALNVWTQLADYPGVIHRNPTCFTIGSKAYAFLGAIQNGINFSRELWEYDIAANTWNQKTLPPALALPAGEKYQVVTYNNKAYFLTGQILTPFVNGFEYVLVKPCLEWDPATGIYKEISFPVGGDILRTVFKQGNRFYFQSDALGYYERIPNQAYELTIE